MKHVRPKLSFFSTEFIFQSLTEIVTSLKLVVVLFPFFTVLLNIWSLSTGSVIQTLTWETSAVGDVKGLFWMDNRRLGIAFQFEKVCCDIRGFL